MVKTSASQTRLTHAQRGQWARDNLATRVQVALNNPFDKDYVAHSFSAVVKFCRVILLVFKTEF
jgi:hypothetical protein